MLCTHRVMDCLASSGRFEVHALCCQYPKETKDEMIGCIHVHRFKPSLWAQMRNSFQQNRKHQILNRICEVIQKAITIPIFPQTVPLTTKRYYHAAAKLQKEKCFDLIVSEHHGLASLITGCKLMKKYQGVRHIAIFWDPVKGQMATVKLPKSFTDRRINEVEKFAAQYTTLQVSTLSMKTYHKEHGDIAADHRIYLDIPSVLKPETEVPTQHLSLLKREGINIVFSGLLSEYYRNALPIIKLLGQTEQASKINMLFFSRGEKEPVEAAARDFPGTIIYHDYIPLDELHTLYRHADYLLNVSHINANMVPSKIFEYMSYGKPVISTYVTDGDSAEKYVSRYSEGLCIDLKKADEDNVAALNKFLSKEHRPVPFGEVKEEFKENTPEKYLEVIDDVVSHT